MNSSLRGGQLGERVLADPGHTSPRKVSHAPVACAIRQDACIDEMLQSDGVRDVVHGCEGEKVSCNKLSGPTSRQVSTHVPGLSSTSQRLLRTRLRSRSELSNSPDVCSDERVRHAPCLLPAPLTLGCDLRRAGVRIVGAEDASITAQS